MAAAKLSGIHANKTYPAQFIHDNLMVEANFIHQAWHAGVQKLLFLGSSDIFPKLAPQPTREGVLLTGPLDPTNESYVNAKIAGIQLCESYDRQYCNSHGVVYRSVMPTNLYGPGDNYYPENSHLMPALIQRFHQAKVSNTPSLVIWGSGSPRSELQYVDYMAAASEHKMRLFKPVFNAKTQPIKSLINVCFGSDVTIAQVANAVAKVLGYNGAIKFDLSKPDGTPRRWIDSSQLNHSAGRRELV